jgi:hypothetical protein
MAQQYITYCDQSPENGKYFSEFHGGASIGRAGKPLGPHCHEIDQSETLPKLQFWEFTTFTHDTPGYNFEKDLSILDGLMWNSPEEAMEGIRRNCVLASPDG